MTAGRNVRVLIIEDDPAIRRFLRNTLRVQDYDVREAETGAEGLGLASQVNPELVILDLGLPDMDGMQIIPQIRESSSVPILVLSSRSDEAGKVMALDLGADDYISKPFSLPELLEVVARVLADRGGS